MAFHFSLCANRFFHSTWNKTNIHRVIFHKSTEIYLFQFTIHAFGVVVVTVVGRTICRFLTGRKFQSNWTQIQTGLNVAAATIPFDAQSLANSIWITLFEMIIYNCPHLFDLIRFENRSPHPRQRTPFHGTLSSFFRSATSSTEYGVGINWCVFNTHESCITGAVQQCHENM